MNNELEWEKVLEWTQNETTYLIHIVTDQQQISIEVQDKYTGDIWQSIFSSTGIEELTTKAKNPKKYAVFTKMLISALLKASDSLGAQILSYRQMNNKFGKPGSQSKAISPQQASKRFLLLTYVGQFQKMQFPLPLMYFADVNTDRLKLTIKRMGQEMAMLREGHSQQQLLKENALLKYQNESLKNKVKASTKVDSSVILQPKLEELQRQLVEKSNQISLLQQKLNEVQKIKKQGEKKLRQAEQKVEQLQQFTRQQEIVQSTKSKMNNRMDRNQQKIQEMINQMNELSAELIYSREKQKKYELKISTLQKQLQKMIATKRNSSYKNNSKLRESSPDDRKSERSVSVKSGRSNTSQKNQSKSKVVNRKTYNVFGQNPSHLAHSNSKKQLSNRKSSIYDSDTESSRMRKMANGRSSPYRQTAPINNKQNTKLTTQRSRNKSKERIASPRPQLAIQSQMVTQGYHSDSSQEQEDRIEGIFNCLKQKRENRNAGRSNNSNTGSKYQKKLETLQQMIRKTALSTRSKH